MKIAQKFTVARPLDEVWAFFQDVPAVARCMPGAELTEDKGDGLYAGKVKVGLGPFGAQFEGEARVAADPAAQSGHVEGKGVDRRGGSRTRMIMDYRLVPADGGTEVTVDADVTLAGAIAQFGRTSLLQETANILVQDFASALERELTPAAAPDTAPPDSASPEVVMPLAESSPETSTTSCVSQTPPTTKSTGPQRPPEAVDVPAPAGTAKPRQDPKAAQPKPVTREIHAGSLGLRALWAWLKSLLRGLLGLDKRD